MSKEDSEKAFFEDHVKTMKNKVFSLIELMVVISIIAVLLTLLLPSLRTARESAKRISCASNMKQIGLVFMEYADEQDGFLIPFLGAFDPEGDAHYLHDSWACSVYMQSGEDPKFFSKAGTVLCCPSVTEISQNRWDRVPYGATAYGILADSTVPKVGARYQSARLPQLKYPSTTMLLGESGASHGIKTVPNFGETTMFAGRHNSIFNLLMTDQSISPSVKWGSLQWFHNLQYNMGKEAPIRSYDEYRK